LHGFLITLPYDLFNPFAEISFRVDDLDKRSPSVASSPYGSVATLG
jgi:hypothetical protein